MVGVFGLFERCCRCSCCLLDKGIIRDCFICCEDMGGFFLVFWFFGFFFKGWFFVIFFVVVYKI